MNVVIMCWDQIVTNHNGTSLLNIHVTMVYSNLTDTNNNEIVVHIIINISTTCNISSLYSVDFKMLLEEGALLLAAAEEIELPRDEHLECLQTTFGHLDFQPMQWDIIRSINK